MSSIPFADRDLIDFVIALPHAVKASATAHQAAASRRARGPAPAIVAEREDKTDFTAVIDARVDFDACYRSDPRFRCAAAGHRLRPPLQ